MVSKERIYDLFTEMAQEAKGLWVPENIVEVEEINSITFLRDFVARNVPVVIRNACKHWPAIKKWDRNYLEEKVQGKVTVAKSDGNADCLKLVKDQLYFCLPFECEMTLEEFYDYKPRIETEVVYVQKQCSSLSTEMPELLQDISELDWAAEAFGSTPDAINIWLGNKNAISSLHKDPYENIYCVVTGRKHFVLLPPTDLPFLYRNLYPTANYNAALEIESVENSPKIPWIPVDPGNPDFEQYPLFRHASPIRVTLDPGDILYLPSLWYHKVSQDDCTIAINYWYDMKFDSRWTWDLFASSLLNKIT